MNAQDTYIFDADENRRGHSLNAMCYSLKSEDNRRRFSSDEASYCRSFGLSTEQQEAVLQRDWTRMLDLGGSIFCIYKLAVLDGRSLQYLGAVFSGMTEQGFTEMMRAGGRSDG
ncbi:protocatechuate 3,4-dioxygenase [Streptomyces sp. NPDC002144]